MSKGHDAYLDGPRPPSEANDTVRRSIITELEDGPLSAMDLSGRVPLGGEQSGSQVTSERASYLRNYTH